MKTLLSLGTIGAVLLAGSQLALAAVTYNGNGDAGFGGAVGNGSLVFSDDGTTISATYNRGTGDFNDALVIYLDSAVGGDNDTTGYTDQGDGLRKAISGIDGGNVSDLTFPVAFGADYVIATNNGFAGLWQLSSGGSHTFVADLGLSPAGTNNAASYAFSLNVGSIGITPNSGESLSFVTTYTSETAFRSTESIGNSISGVQGSNPFTSANAASYTIVPEPSAGLLGTFAGLFLLRRRR